MKRDMDLVRKVLLEVEAGPGFAASKIEIEGYTQEQIGYHILIMCEAGLVRGSPTTAMNDTSPRAIAGRLTWAGHEFLDAARDDTRWQKAMNTVRRIGGVTLPVLLDVLKDLMKDAIRPPQV